MMQPTGNRNFSLTCVLGKDFTLAGSTVEINVRLDHPAIIAYHEEEVTPISVVSFKEIKDERVLFLDVAKAFLHKLLFSHVRLACSSQTYLPKSNEAVRQVNDILPLGTSYREVLT